ncbi:MAG TPA: hypothetical protein VH599_09830 [Ktedonobacterales bacterium]
MAQHTDEPAPDPAEDGTSENLPLVELETILNRPPSRRKRLMQISFVLLAALIALVIFWGDIAPARPAAPLAVPQPANPPPALLIVSNINYGAVTINGKKQAGPLPILVAIHGNTYDISLDAPPFRPISCHVALSHVTAAGVQSGDKRCLAFAAPNGSMLGLNDVEGVLKFEILISLTPDNLPPGQQSQLTAMLTQALTTRQAMTVPAGSYFATGFDAPSVTSQRASAPLRASATVAPVVPQNQDIGLPCVGFICPGIMSPQLPLSLTGHQWGIVVLLASRWRFSTPSGALVSDVAFQGFTEVRRTENTVQLFLSLGANGNWVISPNATVNDAASQVKDTFCAAGENILQQAIGSTINLSIAPTRDQGARGCELQLLVDNAFQGMFLWRFGVLLAVDQQAHTTRPELPIAPPAEIAALAG